MGVTNGHCVVSQLTCFVWVTDACLTLCVSICIYLKSDSDSSETTGVLFY